MKKSLRKIVAEGTITGDMIGPSIITTNYINLLKLDIFLKERVYVPEELTPKQKRYWKAILRLAGKLKED